MPITRQSQVTNMDTDEPLILRGPTERFTRGQAHRLLKTNDVPHDPSAPLDQLLNLMEIHKVVAEFPQPGMLGEVQKVAFTKTQEAFHYEWPNNVPKLRAMCKQRGVMFKLKDKKVTLIKRLNDYMEGLSG